MGYLFIITLFSEDHLQFYISNLPSPCPIQCQGYKWSLQSWLVLLPLVFNKEDPVLYLKCGLHQTLDVDLKLPLSNNAKEKALVFAAQQQMSNIEYERRLLTGTLESSSVRVAIALLGLTKIEVGMEERWCT